MCQISSLKDSLTKGYFKSINVCCCKGQFYHCQFHYCQLPKDWKFLVLSWIFFLQDQPYVKKIFAKFQVQKIHLQKKIQNLPLCSCKGQLSTSIYKLVELKYPFVGESFELEIWHICYQHKYDFMKKKFMAKSKVFSLWEGGKVGNSEIFYMLVNFKYLFLGKSFGLKIWQVCY